MVDRGDQMLFIDADASNGFWDKIGMKELPKLIKIIDQTANKGVIHKNKANNKKSKLASHINK